MNYLMMLRGSCSVLAAHAFLLSARLLYCCVHLLSASYMIHSLHSQGDGQAAAAAAAGKVKLLDLTAAASFLFNAFGW
jgi:hypothetical protein